MKLKSILLLSSALLTFTQSFSQTFVSTGAKKYTLVEEATGNWCGYCPDGAQVIEQQLEPFHPTAVIASWHGYPGTGDAMIYANDPFTSWSGYIEGYPDGTVNRSPAWPNGIGEDRGNWLSDVQSDSVTAPNFEVMMASYYVSTSDSIYITVVAKALKTLTGTWGVNVLIKEDSIPSVGAGYEQHSYYYPATGGPTTGDGQPSWYIGECASACPTYTCDVCAVLPSADYWHNNVVRAVLATRNEKIVVPAGGTPPTPDSTNIYGDSAFVNPVAGKIYTKAYSYHIPSTSNAHFMAAIAMVQNMDPTMAGPLESGLPMYYSNRVIENAIESKVSKMGSSRTAMNDSLKFLGVANNTAALEGVSIFPNPAKNTINVQYGMETPSETKIVITNTIGQAVIQKQYPASGNIFSENISVNNLPNGVYFMSITNNGASINKQFIINR